MVEGGVGVLRRADGHGGEVKVVNGAGGDRGGDGILLPFFVRLADQDSSSDEPKADSYDPKKFCRLGLQMEAMKIR